MFSRYRSSREHDKSKRVSMYKDSVQDAVSEFFYSCSGSQYGRPSKLNRDRDSGYSGRRTPKMSADKAMNLAEERSFNQLSESESEKDKNQRVGFLHPNGEIDDDEVVEHDGEFNPSW